MLLLAAMRNQNRDYSRILGYQYRLLVPALVGSRGGGGGQLRSQCSRS
jgi:hypothetical protein